MPSPDRHGGLRTTGCAESRINRTASSLIGLCIAVRSWWPGCPRVHHVRPYTGASEIGGGSLACRDAAAAKALDGLRPIALTGMDASHLPNGPDDISHLKARV